MTTSPKRWRVTRVIGHEIKGVSLRTNKTALQPIVVTFRDGDVWVAAEYPGTVG